MHDIDAIEAINFEQLATVTDRLLLRGRVARRRLSATKIVLRTDLARGSSPNLARASRPPTAPVSTHPSFAAPLTRREPAHDRTVILRTRRFDTASVAVLAALSTIAAVLATML